MLVGVTGRHGHHRAQGAPVDRLTARQQQRRGSRRRSAASTTSLTVPPCRFFTALTASRSARTQRQSRRGPIGPLSPSSRCASCSPKRAIPTTSATLSERAAGPQRPARARAPPGPGSSRARRPRRRRGGLRSAPARATSRAAVAPAQPAHRLSRSRGRLAACGLGVSRTLMMSAAGDAVDHRVVVGVDEGEAAAPQSRHEPGAPERTVEVERREMRRTARERSASSVPGARSRRWPTWSRRRNCGSSTQTGAPEVERDVAHVLAVAREGRQQDLDGAAELVVGGWRAPRR